MCSIHPCTKKNITRHICLWINHDKLFKLISSPVIPATIFTKFNIMDIPFHLRRTKKPTPVK